MKNKVVIGGLSAIVILTLSGCTAAQRLDTPEHRAEAVQEQFELVAGALADLDEPAVQELRCETTWMVQAPVRRPGDSPPELPLPIDVDEFEVLSLEGANYDEPDPDAEFYSATVYESGTARDAQDRVSLEVVVRVDDQEACLWAMGAPFVVYLGL